MTMKIDHRHALSALALVVFLVCALGSAQ